MLDSKLSAPVFAASDDETDVQRALRQALRRVEAHGAHEFVEGENPNKPRLVAVCGFPLEAPEQDTATLVAARSIIHEMARGLYASDGIEDEFECWGWDYAETVEALNIYVDSADMTDAYVCATIEAAYRRTAPAKLGDTACHPTSVN